MSSSTPIDAASSATASTLRAGLVDLVLTADESIADFRFKNAGLIESDPMPQETPARAWRRNDLPPRPAADFGDIAVSRPRDHEASVIDALLDELLFATL